MSLGGLVSGLTKMAATEGSGISSNIINGITANYALSTSELGLDNIGIITNNDNTSGYQSSSKKNYLTPGNIVSNPINDKTSSDIYYSSVGYTNPRLGFVTYNLNAKNNSAVQSKLSSLNSTKIDHIPTFNIKDQYTLRNELLAINPFKQNQHWAFQEVRPANEKPGEIKYENIFHPSADILTNFNNYKFVFNELLPTLDGYEQTDEDEKDENGKVKGKKLKSHYRLSTVSPALFNPLFMVQHLGITPNVPLLNTSKTNNGAYGGIVDVSNCTIKELVRQSHLPHSILGLATYRYIDFMYCKDLGKIANNHLITLRKFAYPIGDNIFEYHDEAAGDVGRLVTWFGTEENKLEDILNFQYNASWKELKAKIEEVESKEESSSRGPLGMILNSMNPGYNRYQAAGHTSSHNIFGMFGIGRDYSDDNREILRNYDNNKVYTPKNTIQDTVTYEGKLTFTNEFTLTFCYKLRAYDSINPKSAFLDLIGNVLNVTYRRGKFWGGDRKFIGPPQNVSGWKKANAMIDKSWSKASSVLGGIASGNINMGDLLGMFSNAIQALGKSIKDAFNQVKDKGVQGVVQDAGDFIKKTGADGAALGVLKNKLGRPAMYAMDSLLKGDNVGLWHLTVGNPKNPIAVMGNLILTNATIQHSGPLGLDDFPTELKVTCTLKHARSRDAVEIGRMYTKGTNGIYYTSIGKNIDKWYPAYASKHTSIPEAKAGEKSTVDTDEIRLQQVDIINQLADQTENDNTSKAHLVNTPFAAQIEHYNQRLPYDLSIVLDELA